MPIPVSFASWCLPRDSNSEHLVPETSASASCARKAFVGTPTGIRTRRIYDLNVACLPVPPSGQTVVRRENVEISTFAL